MTFCPKLSSKFCVKFMQFVQNQQKKLKRFSVYFCSFFILTSRIKLYLKSSLSKSQNLTFLYFIYLFDVYFILQNTKNCVFELYCTKFKLIVEQFSRLNFKKLLSEEFMLRLTPNAFRSHNETFSAEKVG